MGDQPLRFQNAPVSPMPARSPIHSNSRAPMRLPISHYHRCENRAELCAPANSFTALRPRGHSESLRQFDHAFHLRIPALRGILVSMEIALGYELITAIGKRQEPASWNGVLRPSMVSGQAAHINERCTPTPLDVRFPAICIVRVRVCVCSEP